MENLSVQFPLILSSPAGQNLLLSYSGIYDNNDKPRFNTTLWGGYIIVCDTNFLNAIEMHPMANTTAKCVFVLPNGSIRLQGKFGMAKEYSHPAGSGDFTGRIVVEDKELWSGIVKGTTCSAVLHNIDIELESTAKQIEFQVISNGTNQFDHSVWLDLTLYNS